MQRLLIVVVALLPTLASAQQASPTEQAMSARIIKELQAGLACEVNLLTVQAELAKAQERIKELEKKPAEEKQ